MPDIREILRSDGWRQLATCASEVVTDVIGVRPAGTIRCTSRDVTDENPHVCLQRFDANGGPLENEGESFSFHRDDIPGIIVMLRVIHTGPLGRLAILNEENATYAPPPVA